MPLQETLCPANPTPIRPDLSASLKAQALWLSPVRMTSLAFAAHVEA
jgi:hypothetical protein